MKMTLLAYSTARATATDWRWPPDSVPTGPQYRNPVDLAAEVQVRRGVEVGSEREILIDGLDAVPARVERRGHADRRSVDENLAAVWPYRSGHGLDQRALPCPVVTDQRGDLTGQDAEVGAVERLNVAISLRQAARLEQGRCHR
jgi:hypothetical protein